MAKPIQKGNCGNEQALGLEISDRQIEIFSRRLLPEIKKYFADGSIRKEFEDWRRKQQVGKGQS